MTSFNTNLEATDRVWVPNFELYNSAESITANSNAVREVVFACKWHCARNGLLERLSAVACAG